VATSVCALKKREAVVESGYTDTVMTGAGNGVNVNYPQSVVRVGTDVRNLEVQAVPPSYERSTSGAPTDGVSDAGFGLKYEIGYTSKASYGVNFLATVPTGSSTFTSGAPTYTGNVNLTYTLNSEFGLASTISFQSLATREGAGTVARVGAFVPTLVLTAAVPGNSQLFAEIASFSHAAVGQPSRVLYDGGFQKQISTHVLIDLEAGLAPAPVNGQRQHYIGFGISVGNL